MRRRIHWRQCIDLYSSVYVLVYSNRPLGYTQDTLTIHTDDVFRPPPPAFPRHNPETSRIHIGIHKIQRIARDTTVRVKGCSKIRQRYVAGDGKDTSSKIRSQRLLEYVQKTCKNNPTTEKDTYPSGVGEYVAEYLQDTFWIRPKTFEIQCI